jgi:predicted amidohydrolase YtcJ
MRTILAALLLLLSGACRSAAPAPEVVLAGGRVFTSDEARPWAEAIAVRGDRIVAVGSNAEIRALAGSATRVIELDGRVVVPGINDAHVHAPWVGGTAPIRIVDDGTVEQMLSAIESAVREHPEGTALEGDIPPMLLDDPRLTRETLDALAPRHPVMLGTLAGHSTVHNTAALRWRGVAEDARDTQAGWYGRDANGRLNGWVYEHALWTADRRLSADRPDEAFAESMRSFADRAVRVGITSVQSMPAIDRERAMRLAATMEIPLRWRWIDLQLGSVNEAPSQPMKYILDGTPMERGAALRADYADRAGHRGRLNYSDADIARMVAVAAKSDQPLLVHISGDLGLEKLFAAMRATPANWPAKRVRVEHGDLIAPFVDDARDLGVIIVQNPSHFMLPELMNARFDDERIRTFQTFRSLADRGVRVAIGSDGPINPWLNLMFASMHPRNPPEAMSREQAVIAYTRGSAFAEFAEHEKGTLASGMLADLAVLSQDVFTVPPPELPKTTAVLTMIGGRIVWEAK